MVDFLSGVSGRNVEEFYRDLRENLEKNHSFPGDYVFKFIIPNDQKKLTGIYGIFDRQKYSLSIKESSKSKYISCTVQCFVLDSDQVINIYKTVSKIKGVIML